MEFGPCNVDGQDFFLGTSPKSKRTMSWIIQNQKTTAVGEGCTRGVLGCQTKLKYKNNNVKAKEINIPGVELAVNIKQKGNEVYEYLGDILGGGY